MSAEEYAEKYARYRNSRVLKARMKWATVHRKAELLEKKLSALKQQAATLWSDLLAIESAHPDEVALAGELSQEHVRRVDEARARLAA